MKNLLNEITNIVEKPKVLVCEFDKKFLNIPKEILDYYNAITPKIYTDF